MSLLATPTLRAGAVLGFLTMAVIGWKLADKPEPQPAPAARAADRPARPPRRGGPPEAVRARMTALRAIASPTDRLRATMALAKSIPLSQIPAWLDGHWFTVGEGYDLTLFTALLKERWQQEDPAGLLRWNFKNDPDQARATLATWAAADPQGLLAIFKDRPNPSMEVQALASIAEKEPALALQRLLELARSGSVKGNYDFRQVVEQLAKTAPAALEAALASLPPALRKQAEIPLIKDRMAAAFTAEIRKLYHRPDGWEIFKALNPDGRNPIGDQLLNELANLPPGWRAGLSEGASSFITRAEAEKWCRADLEGFGFTAAQAERLRKTALTRLVSYEPKTCLKLMANMNLEPRFRGQVVVAVFGKFRNNPEQADSLLAMLSSDEERQQARYALAPAEPEPPAAQPGAETQPDPSAFPTLNEMGGWDAGKIAALSGKFQTLPADQKRRAAQILISEDPYGYSENLAPLQGDAIRYLLANPTEADPETTNTLDHASRFAVNWAQEDPAAASDWVQSLPAGDAKLWAQKNLAANWAQYDPEATDRWLSTLPAADGAQVREFLNENAKK